MVVRKSPEKRTPRTSALHPQPLEPHSSPLLSMAALSVEHLKVMAALTVEPAYAFNLLIGWGGYGRAPPDLMVEHLKVMAALSVEPACASSRWRPYQSST